MIGVNSISCKGQTEESSWSVFGTFEENWLTFEHDRGKQGMGIYLFVMTEDDFRVMQASKHAEF